jgi:hypothetical protein
MVIKLPKSILDILNSFKTFMAQCNGAMMRHGKVTRTWNQVMVKLGVLGIIPSGGFAKVVMNARLPDSFVKKKTNTKRARLWLFQVDVYLETHHLKLDKKYVRFT